MPNRHSTDHIPSVQSDPSAGVASSRVDTRPPIPSDWPTVDQPQPVNMAGAAAARLLRSGDYLGAAAGALISDAARARVAVGVTRYGSAVTRHNDRDHVIDALQEIVDAAIYLAAEYDEVMVNGEDDGGAWDATDHRLDCIERAITNLNLAASWVASSRMGTGREVPRA